MPEESTTPDLEETARRFADALCGRDIDAVVAMFAPDAVWSTSGFEGLFEGREAIRGLLETWIEPYEDYELEVEELRDVGNGVTLTVTRQRGRPKGSTVFAEVRIASVGFETDGLIDRLSTYLDIDEARAAAERLAEERSQANA